MSRGNYTKDSSKFWEGRKNARATRDEKLTRLPFSQKVAIVESLQSDRISLRNAKRID
jgi:hypothetical protein